MSNQVTFEQAKKLKELGFDRETYQFFYNSGVKSSIQLLSNHNQHDNVISISSVSEALDWIREEKEIPCAVTLYIDNDNTFFYIGEYRIEGNKMFETGPYDTHPLAESALLDAVLTFLENKL